MLLVIQEKWKCLAGDFMHCQSSGIKSGGKLGNITQGINFFTVHIP